MPEFKLSLTDETVNRIQKIREENNIFEDNKDVIIHAITDLLEKYEKGGL
jgi:beta-mannanase